MGTLLPLPVFGQATAAHPDITDRGAVLRVRVHASGDATDAYVRQVVDVARALLAGAGVATEWAVCVEVACPIDQVRAASIVVIVEAKGPWEGNRCGRAALAPVEASGTVRVSVPCVAGVAERLRQRLDTGSHPMLAMSGHHDLTGAVVAHEIGHVLGLHHGPTGVMREQLDRNDIISLRSDRLAFSAPDAATMRRSAERVIGAPQPALARLTPGRAATP